MSVLCSVIIIICCLYGTIDSTPAEYDNAANIKKDDVCRGNASKWNVMRTSCSDETTHKIYLPCTVYLWACDVYIHSQTRIHTHTHYIHILITITSAVRFAHSLHASIDAIICVRCMRLPTSHVIRLSNHSTFMHIILERRGWTWNFRDSAYVLYVHCLCCDVDVLALAALKRARYTGIVNATKLFIFRRYRMLDNSVIPSVVFITNSYVLIKRVRDGFGALCFK